MTERERRYYHQLRADLASMTVWSIWRVRTLEKSAQSNRDAGKMWASHALEGCGWDQLSGEFDSATVLYLRSRHTGTNLKTLNTFSVYLIAGSVGSILDESGVHPYVQRYICARAYVTRIARASRWVTSIFMHDMLCNLCEREKVCTRLREAALLMRSAIKIT